MASNSFSVNPRYNLQSSIHRPGNRPLTTYTNTDTSSDYEPELVPNEVTPPMTPPSSPHGAVTTNSAAGSSQTTVFQASPNSSPTSSLDSGYCSDHCVKKLKNEMDKHQAMRSRFIETQIAHPVHFNFETSPDSGEIPCHWCHDIFYGLYGLGAKKLVEVIDKHDGTGCIEIAHGYASAEHPPSRMCPKCTLERLIIIACKRHDMRAIRGMTNGRVADDVLLEYSLPGNANQAPFRWCAICPNPAYYACNRPQKDMELGEDMETKIALRFPERFGEDGCGLALCERCVIMNGFMDERIDKLTDNPEDEYGPRADADFLRPQGELMTRIGESLIYES